MYRPRHRQPRQFYFLLLFDDVLGRRYFFARVVAPHRLVELVEGELSARVESEKVAVDQVAVCGLVSLTRLKMGSGLEETWEQAGTVVVKRGYALLVGLREDGGSARIAGALHLIGNHSKSY